MKTSEPLTPAEKASDGWARKLRPLLLPLLLPVVIVVVVAAAQSVDTLGLTLGSHFLECVGSVVLFLGGVAGAVAATKAWQPDKLELFSWAFVIVGGGFLAIASIWS